VTVPRAPGALGGAHPRDRMEAIGRIAEPEVHGDGEEHDEDGVERR